MYQSIYYDFSTYTYYLRDDKQGWMEFQYQPTYWKRTNEWNETARPVLTGGWAVPTKKYSKDDPDLLEKDIDKSLVVLRELYYKEDDVVPAWHNPANLDDKAMANDVAEWVRKYPVQLVAYSARTASAVAARLAPAGIRVEPIDGLDYAQSCDELLGAISSQRLAHSGQEELTKQCRKWWSGK